MTQPRSERDIYTRIVLGSSVPRALGSAMVTPTDSVSVRRRWGMVNAINTNGSLDVNVGGIIIPGLRKLTNYAPTVGERVMIDVVGSDMLVVGTVGNSPLNDFNTRITNLNNSVTGIDSRLQTVESFHTSMDTFAEGAYTQTGTAQSIPNVTDTLVSFPTDVGTSTLITRGASGSGSTFTVQRAGVWTYSTTVRYLAAAGGGERYVTVFVDTGAGFVPRSSQSTGVSTNGPPITLSTGATERLGSGTVFAVNTYQSSGAALSLENLQQWWVSFKLAWLRP